MIQSLVTDLTQILNDPAIRSHANPDPLIQPLVNILTQILNDPAISKRKTTLASNKATHG